jgi:alpha-galactosidase/6-phospho-beta-glucosidase family protein
MPEEKIAIIGGASPYVPGILYSFAHSGDVLAGSEIVLMDVDPSRLPIMTALGQRMVAQAGANLAVTSTTDLDQALEGGTFVLTNFRPGGLEGLRLDEEIPDRYDIMGQETTGPGGTFFALRSIPQVLDLCRHMEDVCPDAWLINYVNPTNFVADAVQRESGVKCVSLCDGGGNGLRYKLPELFGFEQGEVRVRAAGVNHHTWLMELRLRDEDGYPTLLERLRQPKKKGRSYRPEYHEFGMWMLEKFGVWPANLSYLYPYFHHEDALADFRTGHSIYHMFMTDLPEHWRNFRAMAKGEMPIHMDLTKHHTDVGHGDLAVSVIAAIAGDECQEFHVNVPNEGAITNLPREAIVEVPALVDGSGVRPLCMGALPRGVLGLTQSLVAWEELTVDAALSGDEDLVLQAILAHPWTRSTQQAEGVCNEMLAAHAAYLPQFRGR